MDVSIIIVNYNTKDITLDCIDSVFEQTKDIEFEVILVDNDSHDGSKELLGKDKRIKFIEAGNNLGFGNANNLGLKFATGEYIFFLNSDTILLNNSVYIFKKFYESHREKLRLGGIGCQLIDKAGNPIHSGNYFPNWRRDFRAELREHWAHVKHQEKEPRLSVPLLESPFPTFKVDYVTGADLFVSRAVLEKYGSFDADFFMYYEETEMQYRWHTNGLDNYIIDGPKIIHLEGGTSKKVRNNIDKESRTLRSVILYNKKVLGKFDYYIFRFTLAILKIPTLILRRENFSNKSKYIKVLLRR